MSPRQMSVSRGKGKEATHRGQSGAESEQVEPPLALLQSLRQDARLAHTRARAREHTHTFTLSSGHLSSRSELLLLLLLVLLVLLASRERNTPPSPSFTLSLPACFSASPSFCPSLSCSFPSLFCLCLLPPSSGTHLLWSGHRLDVHCFEITCSDFPLCQN